MDEKLQQIFRLRPLQDSVNVLRSQSYIKKIVKLTYKREIKNLLNVEMSVPQAEIILPDPKTLPQIKLEITEPRRNNDEVINDFKATIECLQLI